MLKFTFNDSEFKERRRELRRTQTEAEKVLWQKLRNRQMNGLKFFRQYSVGAYILDFYCPQVRYGIELDGAQHTEQVNVSYDMERSNQLGGLNINVVRFWNHDVLNQLDKVMSEIRSCISSEQAQGESPLAK